MALSVATVGGRTATDTASDTHSCVAFLKSARIVPILDSSLSPPFVCHLLPLAAAVTLDVLDCECLERPCNGRGSSHLYIALERDKCQPYISRMRRKAEKWNENNFWASLSIVSFVPRPRLLQRRNWVWSLLAKSSVPP